LRVSANTEAIGHLTEALSLLKTLPPSDRRAQLELPLQFSLSTAMIVAQGWSAPSVRVALDRARELCHGAESTPQLIPILRSLYTHYHALAEHHIAYELAQQLVALAQETSGPANLLMAHHALGQSQVEFAEFVAARETLERGLVYHDPEQYQTLAYLYGEEHGISSRLHLGDCLLALGYPDQGLGYTYEALSQAEVLAHPHVLAYALFGVSTIHLWRRESQEALEFSAKAIALCDERGVPFWRATASVSHGHALAMQGRTGEGIVEVSDALSAYRSIGAKVLQTMYLASLADVYRLAGRADAGLEAVDEGLHAAHETGERCVEAELYRLRAELLRMEGKDDQAEADLWRALDAARAQQARLLELRTALSLSRLWRDQGKREEARQMLAGIYGWFAEGFETRDLQEARTLLEELGAP
jgi:tetratricopeptide (TPR) repeat protein